LAKSVPPATSHATVPNVARKLLNLMSLGAMGLGPSFMLHFGQRTSARASRCSTWPHPFLRHLNSQ
jgi:hypothetical protein